MSNISFKYKGDILILVYKPKNDISWIVGKIRENDIIDLKRTFVFRRSDLLKPSYKEISEKEFHDIVDSVDVFEFRIGRMIDGYHKIKGKYLDIAQDVYFSSEFRPQGDHFVGARKVSIFAHIAKLTKSDIYVGGTHEDAMPAAEFLNLLSRFPKDYELNLYIRARISNVLMTHFDDVGDAELSYNKYRNKKESARRDTLNLEWIPYEIDKYESIRSKLARMLRNEDEYSEKQWQIEIKNILCLVYPKYVRAFPEARIRDSHARTNRFVDFLLMDHEGHVDILEIKKPMGKLLVTPGSFRDNHIPVRELSGTVIQMEKYLYHLVRSGEPGVRRLNRLFAGEIPDGITIRVTNPVGLLLLGRDEGLSDSQKLDFEVIKRHYKNVVEIITYDDLLRRIGLKIRVLKETGIGESSVEVAAE